MKRVLVVVPVLVLVPVRLKQRGLLDSTLVIWGGEFGRTPTTQKSAAGYSGRDHNMQAFTSWMAGGGIRGGTSYGTTDDFGHMVKRMEEHKFPWLYLRDESQDRSGT